jgi:hypothetical protein
MNRESFIGLWDMYCGWVHSELLLQTDNSYRHSLWGAVQSHWGVWSLVEQAGQPYLLLELRGAQPAAYPGLTGMVPMNWPETETWAITAVTPNQINFYQGHMVRRAFVQPPSAPWMGMPFFAGVKLPTAPPIPFPQIPIPPPPPVMTFPPVAYSAPTPPPPPDAHQSPVMAQWMDSMKAANDLYAKMLSDDAKTSSGINDMYKQESASELAQRQAQIKAGENSGGAKAFNQAINPSKLRH